MAQLSREQLVDRLRAVGNNGLEMSMPGSKQHSAFVEVNQIADALKSIDPKEVLANINPPTIALQITTQAGGDQITYRLEVPPQDTISDFDTLIELSKIAVFIHTAGEVEEPKS